MQGNGQFAIDLKGCLQTSDEDPRTGTFPQMRPTMGDTACSVKGVLKLKEGSCYFLLLRKWVKLVISGVECHINTRKLI